MAFPTSRIPTGYTKPESRSSRIFSAMRKLHPLDRHATYLESMGVASVRSVPVVQEAPPAIPPTPSSPTLVPLQETSVRRPGVALSLSLAAPVDRPPPNLAARASRAHTLGPAVLQAQLAAPTGPLPPRPPSPAFSKVRAASIADSPPPVYRRVGFPRSSTGTDPGHGKHRMSHVDWSPGGKARSDGRPATPLADRADLSEQTEPDEDERGGESVTFDLDALANETAEILAQVRLAAADPDGGQAFSFSLEEHRLDDLLGIRPVAMTTEETLVKGGQVVGVEDANDGDDETSSALVRPTLSPSSSNTSSVSSSSASRLSSSTIDTSLSLSPKRSQSPPAHATTGRAESSPRSLVRSKSSPSIRQSSCFAASPPPPLPVPSVDPTLLSASSFGQPGTEHARHPPPPFVSRKSRAVESFTSDPAQLLLLNAKRSEADLAGPSPASSSTNLLESGLALRAGKRPLPARSWIQMHNAQKQQLQLAMPEAARASPSTSPPTSIAGSLSGRKAGGSGEPGFSFAATERIVLTDKERSRFIR
ncbi:hypothetical protein JCM10212_001249 [Sporobolomyces blumeae]